VTGGARRRETRDRYQAQDMVRRDGIMHLIGLYHGQPLPLDSGKLLICGYRLDEPLGALDVSGGPG
jgi:hypothetical protein